MDMHAPGVVPGGLRPTSLQAVPTKPKRKASFKLAAICAACCLTVIICLTAWFVVGARQAAPHQTKKIQTTADAYKIVDDPLGLTFSISKKFQPMSSDELKKLNPFFVYGYEVPDVAKVRCVISQTVRSSPAAVSPEDLGKGTFAQLQKSFPDASAVGYQQIALKNRRQAAELVATYHDDGVLVRQVEVVTATGARTSFAFCTSPDPLYGYYLPKFSQFFTSLEVY
jgi:hypothetical protein